MFRSERALSALPGMRTPEFGRESWAESALWHLGQLRGLPPTKQGIGAGPSFYSLIDSNNPFLFKLRHSRNGESIVGHTHTGGFPGGLPPPICVDRQGQ